MVFYFRFDSNAFALLKDQSGADSDSEYLCPFYQLSKCSSRRVFFFFYFFLKEKGNAPATDDMI